MPAARLKSFKNHQRDTTTCKKAAESSSPLLDCFLKALIVGRMEALGSTVDLVFTRTLRGLRKTMRPGGNISRAFSFFSVP